MTRSVTLLTEREPVERMWRQALTPHQLGCRVLALAPSALAEAVQGQAAVVVDVDGSGLDANDLLSTIGFVRASGVLPIVHVDRDRDALEEIVTKLCDGLVSSCDRDVAQVAAVISRRVDGKRSWGFAFVTISPCGDDVLAIMQNGDAVLHSRPIDASDDGSEISSIHVDSTASKATLRLKSGAISQLTAEAMHVADATDGQSDIAIDGERLGARLRELRLAAGLTQAELARRTGIHRPNIARVEAGRHTPSLETLARIANAIGVSTTHVLVSRES